MKMEQFLMDKQDFLLCPLSHNGHLFTTVHYMWGKQIKCRMCYGIAIEVDGLKLFGETKRQ